MTQPEGPKVSALPDDNLVESLKYQRVGHIDTGKVSDRFAMECATALPGEVLPKRWRYHGAEKFKEKFGEGAKWSKTASYHGFFFDGEYILRMWTDVGKVGAYTDIDALLVPVLLAGGFSVESIPPGSLKKCKPLEYRIKINTIDELYVLIESVKKVYGA